MGEVSTVKMRAKRIHLQDGVSGVLATTWSERSGTGLGKPSLTLETQYSTWEEQEQSPLHKDKKRGKSEEGGGWGRSTGEVMET
jgi:hypothetical protein